MSEAERHELAKRPRVAPVEPKMRAVPASSCCLLRDSRGTWCGERAECSGGGVAMWARRFRTERLAGLYSRHRGQTPLRCTPSVET